MELMSIKTIFRNSSKTTVLLTERQSAGRYTMRTFKDGRRIALPEGVHESDGYPALNTHRNRVDHMRDRYESLETIEVYDDRKILRQELVYSGSTRIHIRVNENDT